MTHMRLELDHSAEKVLSWLEIEYNKSRPEIMRRAISLLKCVTDELKVEGTNLAITDDEGNVLKYLDGP